MRRLLLCWRQLSVPFECIPFHEIICFKHVPILHTALIGDPRRTIQVDLLKSRAHLQCSCCGSHDSFISPSMHDTSIMECWNASKQSFLRGYKLAQEYGDLINLHDWYQSFKATILGSRSKTKRKGQTPVSKKKKTAPMEVDAMIQARFCRAVIELQITGLLRMPSKRRPDFVQRVAFGL
ncbi:putative origin recognition complex, subunit 3 [Dioscorea sansibarensis]